MGCKQTASTTSILARLWDLDPLNKKGIYRFVRKWTLEQENESHLSFIFVLLSCLNVVERRLERETLLALWLAGPLPPCCSLPVQQAEGEITDQALG